MENGSVVLRAEQVKKYFPVQGGLGRPKRMVKAVDGVDLEVKKGRNLRAGGRNRMRKKHPGTDLNPSDGAHRGKSTDSGKGDYRTARP